MRMAEKKYAAIRNPKSALLQADDFLSKFSILEITRGVA